MWTFVINFRYKSCISAKYRAKPFWFNFCVQEMYTCMKIDVMSIFFRWDNIKFNIITLKYTNILCNYKPALKKTTLLKWKRINNFVRFEAITRFGKLPSRSDQAMTFAYVYLLTWRHILERMSSDSFLIIRDIKIANPIEYSNCKNFLGGILVYMNSLTEEYFDYFYVILYICHVL